MNLNVIRNKNKTEDSLLSQSKSCDAHVKQTHTKRRETLEFKITKSTEEFSFKPPISIEGSWMMSLTSLKVYNSILNITEEN